MDHGCIVVALRQWKTGISRNSRSPRNFYQSGSSSMDIGPRHNLFSLRSILIKDSAQKCITPCTGIDQGIGEEMRSVISLRWDFRRASSKDGVFCTSILIHSRPAICYSLDSQLLSRRRLPGRTGVGSAVILLMSGSRLLFQMNQSQSWLSL